MLSPAERRALSEIEAQVASSDPELARVLTELRRDGPANTTESPRRKWHLLLWLLLAEAVMVLILAAFLVLGPAELPPAGGGYTPPEGR